MSHHKIEYDYQCAACQGTGLYVGFAEQAGYAVVCSSCKGTGKVHRVIEYDDYEGRQPREGVHTVLACNPGIVVGGDLDFGGQSFAAWEAGKSFPPGSEMRDFTCPAWWYQTCNYARRPHWDECEWGRFSDCTHFTNKSVCWRRFDREEGK